MGSRMATATHLLRTTFALCVFTIWALWLAVVVLPFQRLRHAGDHDRRAQETLHLAARSYLRFANRLGFFRLVQPGGAELAGPGPRLVVANHPSMLDVVVIVALLPQVDCVINASWLGHPFLGRLARAAGHISNDPGPAAVAECVRRLASGRTVAIFPEGTRSPAGGLGPFRRGASHVALRSGVDLTPMVFRYDPPALTGGQSWYDSPAERSRVTVQTLEPISPEGVALAGVSQSMGARKLSAELREAFEKALENTLEDTLVNR
jgi:1-acyl-sn-glycerol-3-phosphate acyltransferase